MDGTYVAIAGIALVVMGVVGFVAVTAFFVAAVLRYGVLPYVWPVIAHAAAEAREWATPPQRSRPALARGPVRTPPPRR